MVSLCGREFDSLYLHDDKESGKYSNVPPALLYYGVCSYFTFSTMALKAS